MKVSDETISEIADNLEMGLLCFINKETGQLLSIPNEINLDDDDLSEEFEAWQEDVKVIKESRDSFIQIEGMTSRDSFHIMADFSSTVQDENLKHRLLESLQVRKPFAHFKYEIDNSGSERERWFQFKRQRFIEWIKAQLDLL